MISITILRFKLTSSNTTHLARCLQGKNSAYKVTLNKYTIQHK